MIYLTGVHNAAAGTTGVENLGLLAQPGNSNARQVAGYATWAADNGCFAQGESFSEAAWWRWLWRVSPEAWPGRRRSFCLFATAPDVVCDPVGTYRRGWTRLHHLRNHGIPAAFVAQDGLEDLEMARRSSFWDEFDCLFLGGSTAWKESERAAWLVGEALNHRKWVHMGRVNSWRRLEIAAAMGCQSVDGNYLQRAPAANLPSLIAWIERVNGPHLQARLPFALEATA